MNLMIFKTPSVGSAARYGLNGLLLCFATVFCTGANAASPDSQADFSYTFDDNLTRANAKGTILTDRSFGVHLSRPVIFPLAVHARAVLTGSLSGEIFELNKGLNHLSGAVQGQLQYRSSAEFGTPTFALFAKIAADQYQSRLRDGLRYSAGISVRQTLTDRISYWGALAHNLRNGKSAVFDNQDNSARFNFDYSLSSRATLYLGGEYRRGDVVTSAPKLWGTYNSNAFILDDAFSGAQIYSFRFNGTTELSKLGINLGIGPHDAIDFFWRRARSSVNYVTPSWSLTSASYVSNQYSVAYLLRF